MQASENRTSKAAILWITTILSFLIPFMGSAMTIALPSIGAEFHLDVIMLSWLTTVYVLTSASLLIPFGKLADIHGRMKVFTIGTIVFALGTLMSILSFNGAMLLVSRSIQGIGGAASFATCIAILTAVFPLEERGKVLGINAAAIYLGLSLGPPIGGVITQYLGWRGIFEICCAAITAVVFITLWKVKTPSQTGIKEKFNFLSSIVYTLTLVLFMLGVTFLAENPALAVTLLISGFVMGVLFFGSQGRSKKPLVDLKLFKGNRSFIFSNLAALANYSGTFAVSMLLSLYLQYVKGFDPIVAGLIMIASPVVQAIVSPISGRLSDRIEPRILSSVGMAISAVGILMLTVIGQDTTILYIMASLVILGFGYALFSSPNTYAVMSSVSREFLGIASATLGTARQIGMMVSLAISTIVFNIVIGQVEITPQYYGALITSVRIIFAILAGICFAAVFASLARGNVHSGGSETVGENGN